MHTFVMNESNRYEYLSIAGTACGNRKPRAWVQGENNSGNNKIIIYNTVSRITFGFFLIFFYYIELFCIINNKRITFESCFLLGVSNFLSNLNNL